MLGKPKNVFWEALFLTVVVFFFGLLLGFAFEQNRVEDINEYYLDSEIFLTDILALNSFTDITNTTCEILADSNLEFADRIYGEAKILENYESSGRLSNNMKLAHKRYDLLRTFLWINTIKTDAKCPQNIDTIVYLYNYETDDLAEKAEQTVWSRILFDLKQEKGKEIILIPIAVDSNLTSLNALIKQRKISNFPAVIVNEDVIYQLSSIGDLETHLN